jgi:hypothetical protein
MNGQKLSKQAEPFQTGGAMRNLLLGFVLGLFIATADFVGAEGFIDLQSGTMYQHVPGGLLNLNTG